MKSIAVFCSANDIDHKYVAPAVELARLMVKGGHDVVWGGSDTGLMKQIADAVEGEGGRLIGISVEFFRSVARKGADEMIVTKNLGERKALLLKRADAFVTLPGGIGTLDEVAEMLELKKINTHAKPIVILNTDNFYAGFKMQLERMISEGFISKKLDQLVYFADTPRETIDYLNKKLV